MPSRLYACLACFLLAACADVKNAKLEQNVPQETKVDRAYSRGSLTGEDGLLSMGGSSKNNNDGGALGVNSYLWRATLDTLAFMPLASADPFGGVILTDWYEDPAAPGERYKITALILDKSLRADGIKISVFKQKMQNGTWRDQKSDESLSRRLEDTILTRARELRITQLGR